MDWLWTLLEMNCTGCGICVDLCPYDALAMPEKQAYPEGILGACTGCGLCVEECPFGAIAITEDN
jgi:formate hydrogenlyase subunit 6/NADH:ubiquinone oxidoreductase subunit I